MKTKISLILRFWVLQVYKKIGLLNGSEKRKAKLSLYFTDYQYVIKVTKIRRFLQASGRLLANIRFSRLMDVKRRKVNANFSLIKKVLGLLSQNVFPLKVEDT